MRYPSSSPRTVVYQFGPGPVTPVVKLLIWTNVVMFVLSWLVPDIIRYLGLQPAAVFSRLFIWQPVTYMFLHAGVFHLLFNMLALWMFGVELERLWGRDFFLRYYLITGIGAGATTLALALAPGEVGAAMRDAVTVGASGAIYGLLLAYALYFPDKPIYMWALFPIPAKYFVMIMGAIAFMSSVGGDQGGVANSAHLGGLVVGYVYLRVWRGRPLDGLKYRYVKFRMNRLRRKFDVHAGGRGGWDERIH
jgi:membrane associated rhomboid family serine protease